MEEIVSLPSSVFSGAIVDTILLFAEKRTCKKFHATSVSIKYFNKKTSINSIENPQRIFKVETKDWYSSKPFNLQTDNIEQNLLTKIEMQKNQLEILQKC
ncbi:MAG: hypothetical protein IPJ26_07345, partial [Bacteroidetes bacterium]|nr:hypothetical protein [Bacteroidota bacterium]